MVNEESRKNDDNNDGKDISQIWYNMIEHEPFWGSWFTLKIISIVTADDHSSLNLCFTDSNEVIRVVKIAILAHFTFLYDLRGIFYFT